MTLENDPLEIYETHYAQLIYMSIANGDFDIANFWLNTYKHDLASTIDSMRPERASMCKVHINDLEDELIGAMMLDGVDYYFGEDEAEKERYLRELREG